MLLCNYINSASKIQYELKLSNACHSFLKYLKHFRMRSSSLLFIAIMCSLCMASCKTLFKKEPDCVLRAWIIKDQATGTMVATNMSPFTFDTTAITILSLNQCGNCPFNNSYKVNPTQAILNQYEIDVADTLYKKAVAQYNAALPDNQKPYKSIDMSKSYKRQYIAAMLVNGHKVVWMNAFCSSNANWKQRLIQVQDGGSCYFTITINLTEKSNGTLRVNGEG